MVVGGSQVRAIVLASQELSPLKCLWWLKWATEVLIKEWFVTFRCQFYDRTLLHIQAIYSINLFIPVVTCQAGRRKCSAEMKFVVYWPHIIVATKEQWQRDLSLGACGFCFLSHLDLEKNNINTNGGFTLLPFFKWCVFQRWGHFLSTSCTQVTPSRGCL